MPPPFPKLIGKLLIKLYNCQLRNLRVPANRSCRCANPDCGVLLEFKFVVIETLALGGRSQPLQDLFSLHTLVIAGQESRFA